VAFLLAGCGERRAQVGSATEPASSPTAASPAPTASPADALPTPGSARVPVATSGAAPGAPVGVAPAFAISPRETSLTPPEPPRPEPTAHYASLVAARDAIDAMLRRGVSPADTAIHFSREAVTFDYIYIKASAHGLAVRVVVNDTTACPHDKLMESLRAAGWVDDWSYSADGDDGTQMGLVCRQYLCVVQGRWHGYDPTDTTYVPPPGCEVTATCVPRRLDDFPDR
jgi:hypothetical protein